MIAPRAGRWTVAIVVATLGPAALATRPARADDEPTIDETRMPCRGDACAEMAPDQRTPLLVARPAPEPPPPPPPPRTEHLREFVGGRLTFGRAFTQGVAGGFYGRLDTEVMSVYRPGMIGLRIGLEGWGSSDGGGGGIPWAFAFGAAIPFSERPRAVRFVISGELGWEWAFYDRLRHTGQFGILSPLASGVIGLDFRGVRLLGDASAQYRWGWGDADRSQFRLGASLSFNSELWDGPR